MTRIDQLMQDQAFANALAVLLNTTYNLGFKDGAKAAANTTKVTPPPEPIMAIDIRNLQRVAVVRASVEENPDMPLDATIERLNLEIRPYNTLKRHGIITIADLLSLDATEMIEMMRHGHPSNTTRQRALLQIKLAVERYGYRFDITAAQVAIYTELLDES